MSFSNSVLLQKIAHVNDIKPTLFIINKYTE
jgi:hypothetical protein